MRVGKMNIATSPAAASRYNVLGVPYLLIFDNGQYKEGLPGAVPKQELMIRMAHYL